jgi:hypothetical protein
MITLTAYVEWDSYSKLYGRFVLGITDAHTLAASLYKLKDKFKGVIKLCLEDSSAINDLPRFEGVQQIEVAL